MIGVLLTAAGASTRFGAGEPKVLAEIDGRTLLRLALDALRDALPDATFVVAAPPAHEHRIRSLLPEALVVAGGATRQASVAAGIAAFPDDADPILVHDAARPIVPAAVVHRVVAAISASGAAVPVLPVTDTIHGVERMPDVDRPASLRPAPPRAALVAAQTPQGARRALLCDALARAARDGMEYTDEAAMLLAAGHPVVAVVGDPNLAKITTREDLEALRARFLRT